MHNNIVFFDGVCNLCHGTVVQLIEIDKRNVLSFASLQSQFASEFLAKKNFTSHLDTILYYRDGKLYQRSDAALYILKDIGGWWSKLFILRFIPKFLRDMVYDIVASNRYLWFGKKDQCMLPSPQLQAKFLE